MLFPKKIKPNKNFVGRAFEISKLDQIAKIDEASIVIIYGRRRVGKTELIEQVFRERNLIKFEGLEGQDEMVQRQHVMEELAEYTKNPLLGKVPTSSWREVFKYIAAEIKTGSWTLYLEELQWMANYQTTLISDLKYVWDNELRHNPNLILVLCGSSPSFMINKVLHSKALYNRSQHEIALRPFSFEETREYLNKYPLKDVMDAYLSVGGIPEYLKRLKQESSLYLGLCKESFVTGGFFTTEHDRIFTSSLAKNPLYKKIIDFLSKQKFANRTEIAEHLKIATGGGLSDLLEDLTACGFIDKYAPIDSPESVRIVRYCLRDNFLQFFFKFIQPKITGISRGDFNDRPTQGLSNDIYLKWLGFAFERACRDSHAIIAKHLGFSAVEYQVGPYFSRSLDKESPGFQIDLIFDRADHVYTVCEIKYLQSKVPIRVIAEFEQKLAYLPNQEKYKIHKVLISTLGAVESVVDRGYFDDFLILEDLFN